MLLHHSNNHVNCPRCWLLQVQHDIFERTFQENQHINTKDDYDDIDTSYIVNQEIFQQDNYDSVYEKMLFEIGFQRVIEFHVKRGLTTTENLHVSTLFNEIVCDEIDLSYKAFKEWTEWTLYGVDNGASDDWAIHCTANRQVMCCDSDEE
jgi:hypothetical protein